MRIFLKSLRVLAVLTILIAVAVTVDWHEAAQLFLRLDPLMCLLALTCVILQVLLLGWRWQLLLNAQHRLTGYGGALGATAASQLANALFITSIGGLVTRIALARQSGMSLLTATCAAVADRLMTFLAIVTFAALLLPFLMWSLPASLSSVVLAAVAVILLGLPLLSALGWLTFRRLFLRQRKIAAALIYLRRLRRKPGLASAVCVASLLAQGCFFLSLCFAAKAAGVHADMMKIFAFLPAITLISSLPVGFGGWGVREGAFIFGLGIAGVAAEPALLISVQSGLFGMLAPAIALIPSLSGRSEAKRGLPS